MSQQSQVQELIEHHQRRLHKLQEKAAIRGIDTPPEILTEIEDIEAEIERLKELATSKISSVLGNAPPFPNLVIGREKDFDELYRRLTKENGRTLAVQGLPGVGKTTLVSKFAYDSRVRQLFPDNVLWVQLGQHPDLSFELGIWMKALGDNPERYTTLNSRRGRLSALLQDRHMLLIIDDVWDADHAPLFQVGGPACRTLITIREIRIARHLGLPDQAIYRISVLSLDDSVSLLCTLAPFACKLDPNGIQRLAKKLEGLPLALHVAGRLLAAEASRGWGINDLLVELEEGTRIINEKAPADRSDVANQTTPTVAALLEKSTKRLDSETCRRFAKLGVFREEPATFSERSVSVVWRVDDPRPTLRELEDRGLIIPVSNGRFYLHALLAIHARALEVDYAANL
jgi:hypothetical protein